jgi:methionyl-tRNA synthetase
VLEGIRFVSSYLYPLIPESVDRIRRQLGFEVLPFSKLKWGEVSYAITASDVLFPKIELKEEERFLANLKIGKILEAEDHPEADKLMVLQVDLGAEKRQIVAGVRGHYAHDELVGRNIVVVTNLKYAKLRGKESQGMLLAASDPSDKKIVLLGAPKSKPGDVVQAGELKNASDQITINEFFDTLKIAVKGKKAVVDGKVLKTEVEDISVDGETGWKVR